MRTMLAVTHTAPDDVARLAVSAAGVLDEPRIEIPATVRTVEI